MAAIVGEWVAVIVMASLAFGCLALLAAFFWSIIKEMVK